MSLSDALNLIDGEQAWRAEVWRGDGGVLAERVDEAAFVELLRGAAKALLLEVVEVPGGGVALVHRQGWPFALACFDGNAAGRPPESTRPVGPGDEVMRELCDAFAGASGYVLVIRDEH